MTHWRSKNGDVDLEPGKVTTLLANIAPFVFWGLLFASILYAGTR